MAQTQYVTIKAGRRLYHGKVISAANYGTPEQADWYIEFHDDRAGALYVKQIQDGFADATITFSDKEDE
jgi:hypothetical protein